MKYVLKTIQAGRLPLSSTVTASSGMAGVPLTLKASDSTRYLLTEVVTNTSPSRLRLKRQGKDLQITLPGGDAARPDIVIQDYYASTGVSLEGLASSGQVQAYDTTALAAGNSPGSAAGGEALAASSDSFSAQLGGGTDSSLSPLDHPWAIAGVVAGAGAIAALSRGSSESSSPSAAELALQTLRSFTNDSAAIGSKSASTPTLASYSALDLKTFKSLTDTLATDRKALNDSGTSNGAESNTFLTAAILNTALDRLAGDATLTQARLQAMVDSYYRILREADGSSTINTDVYADTTNDAANAALYNDPTAADYANVGAVVGSTLKSLALLNDAVGRFDNTRVDSVAKIDELARAAENVMLQAKGLSTAASGGPAVYASNADWITGLTGLGLAGINANNIAAIRQAIDNSTDNTSGDGSAVDTVQELIDLARPVISLQVLKDFTNDTAAIGSKTAATPTLADWSAQGLTANTSLTNGADVTLASAAYWATSNPANGLAALNSALDTFAGSAVTTTVLQNIVDSYGRVLQEADGSRAINTDVSLISNNVALAGQGDLLAVDFSNLGVTANGVAVAGWTTAASGLLIDAIAGLNSSAVDTAGELNALALAADNVMKLAISASGGSYSTAAEWGSGLTSLGLTGVTSANVDAIKAAITASSDNGTGVDTITELQTMVSRVRIADYATSSSNVAPVLIDYQSFNSSAGASNLAAYNDAVNVKPSNTFTDTEISDLVTSYNTLLASADGNRLTTPTTAATALDYSHVGITVGSYAGTQATTLTLLNDVLSGLTSDKIDTVGELRTIEGVVGKILTMAANPKTSGASVADYVGLTQADLGLLGLRSNDGQLASSTNLTGAQVSYFNNQVIYSSNDGSAVDSFNELQLLLNNATIAA